MRVGWRSAWRLWPALAGVPCSLLQGAWAWCKSLAEGCSEDWGLWDAYLLLAEVQPNVAALLIPMRELLEDALASCASRTWKPSKAQ